MLCTTIVLNATIANLNNNVVGDPPLDYLATVLNPAGPMSQDLPRDETVNFVSQIGVPNAYVGAPDGTDELPTVTWRTGPTDPDEWPPTLVSAVGFAGTVTYQTTETETEIITTQTISAGFAILEAGIQTAITYGDDGQDPILTVALTIQVGGRPGGVVPSSSNSLRQYQFVVSQRR